MAFNLTKALGYENVMSNLDNREIVSLPLDKIVENEKNFFTVDDVQDLKDSMAINGMLQPILVVADGDHYRIIAGHRRRKAASELLWEGKSEFEQVPCVILPEMSEAMEWTTLIQTNTAARELSYPEKMKAARQLKATIIQLRDEGVNIPGKMRDILSEQLEISRTELARMDVIQKNLSEYWTQELEDKMINPTCAYEIARMTPDEQEALREFYEGPDADDQPSLCQTVVENWREKNRAKDWLRSDCKFAAGYYANDLRSRGMPVPCDGFKNILRHKDKGHPEKCCGCCGECPNISCCKDACSTAKNHFEAIVRKETREADTIYKKKLFERSKYPEVVKRFCTSLHEGGFEISDISGRLKRLESELGISNTQAWSLESVLDFFSKAEIGQNLPQWVLFIDAICMTLDITPNWLFGYEEE